ncbi:MAG: hypothetical protein KTR20_00990 [Cellvibrionaceae bacterium]|nr:hypothetical protein [Cellvibrionaceae bacterium]
MNNLIHRPATGPRLTLVKAALIRQYPQTLVMDFVLHILGKKTPSQALHQLMAEHQLATIDDGVIIDLLKAVYPGIVLFSLGSWLYENHYPQRTDLVSDEDFDEQIVIALRQSFFIDQQSNILS